jgi:ABC-type uncharacterized transport system YnjBCD permease subunit
LNALWNALLPLLAVSLAALAADFRFLNSRAAGGMQ